MSNTALITRTEKTSSVLMNEVYKKVESILSSKTNDMTKIMLKCWVHHSELRAKHNRKPLQYTTYTYARDKQLYLDYIKYNFINCDEFGGKEKGYQIVEKWFS